MHVRTLHVQTPRYTSARPRVLASLAHADAPHPLALLRARRERPRSRAAEQRDELAATAHSITSSASESKLSEIVTPSVGQGPELTEHKSTLAARAQQAGKVPTSSSSARQRPRRRVRPAIPAFQW